MTAGTAALPAIAFDGDPDSGIFRGGDNELGIATNGVERVEFGTSEVVFNDGGEDIDFRIEGDTNSSLFFVDASAEAVGIGTISPAAVLTTYAGSFDASDNTVFDGVGLFLESSVAGGDGNYGSALAWNRPGSARVTLLSRDALVRILNVRLPLFKKVQMLICRA
jgi:hypothetical protein